MRSKRSMKSLALVGTAAAACCGLCGRPGGVDALAGFVRSAPPPPSWPSRRRSLPGRERCGWTNHHGPSMPRGGRPAAASSGRAAVRRRAALFALQDDAAGAQLDEPGGELRAGGSVVDGSSSSPPHGRRVAVLFPEPDDGHDNDGKGNDRWHVDAAEHLGRISRRCSLPTFDISGNRDEETDYSHYLTAVPYERAGTYALAIHHVENSSSSNSKRRNSGKTKKRPGRLKLNPLFVDLCPGQEGRLGYRLSKNASGGDGGGGEMLLKALGLKKMLAERVEGNAPLVVYDLTAGLARDTLVILSSVLPSNDGDAPLPLRLHMVERDPIVAALLTDAMRRLDLLAASSAIDEENMTARRLQQCLSMEEGGGATVLHRLKTNAASSVDGTHAVPYPPDVVYLDPMFPPRKKKSASVKRDMAMLHSLLGTAEANFDNAHVEDDTSLSEDDMRAMDERELLLAACDAATRRVVVKRPVNAEPLGLPSENDDFPTPSYEVRGSVNRFDVYIIS